MKQLFLNKYFTQIKSKAPVTEKTETSEYEHCICCGGVLNIKKSTPIYERTNYISGAGQLCEDCYFELNLNKNEPKK